MLVAEDSTGSCSSNGSGRASLPNGLRISCKRPERTYVPQLSIGELPRVEARFTRVCRLHARLGGHSSAIPSSARKTPGDEDGNRCGHGKDHQEDRRLLGH